MVYPFLPVLAQGLGVSVSTITLAVTGRSLTGALGPFLASVGDSRGRKAGMLFGIGIYTLGAGLVVFWPAYPAFFAALTLCGLGTLVFIPSMQAYVGDRVPYQQRGFALALTELSWSISFILGVPLAGFLIARYGWLAPFPLLALLGAIV
ncbi:MAG: MFS transporter, partial [Chloroflexi bacterium]|nr:MFS transporter [Chloroflexota bacterium]